MSLGNSFETLTPAPAGSITIPAKDGFPLAARYYGPTLHPVAVVVIASATGLHQSFYASFSRWLSTHGILVYTFDYRYFGMSFPPPYQPSTFTPEERHKALRTAPADIDISETKEPQREGKPLIVVGHSLGGQVMTLLEEEFPIITRFLNICGGKSFVGNLQELCFLHTSGGGGDDDDRSCVLWKQAESSAQLAEMEKKIAKSLETDGVFRCRSLGMGYDIPYGPGRQWLEFYRHPLCVASLPQNASTMRKVNKPYLYVGFDDDATMSK
ncbi:Alpha/Beta hydrolase protein [Cantharellus anzutake]|uniref:Alpha/Beta hydrolase protein n=1 Tax=Cantharellus anzutake TaxID=1750568 RepID=UPI001905A786|nr:Alpha/Beta hydrolase protein [Cantharellus anzutake]KAF8325772.1 Alpha/Beta hydrolase protein [Cantharellus anzutake]